jgi:hypothetical protein
MNQNMYIVLGNEYWDSTTVLKNLTTQFSIPTTSK